MPAKQGANRPCIFIRIVPHQDRERKLRELTAGMEEEGIPCQIADATEQKAGAGVLAHEAAVQSQLAVGVGVTDGEIAVHYAKLPVGKPLFLSAEQQPAVWRSLGYNAARLVKGIPFKGIAPEPEAKAASCREQQSMAAEQETAAMESLVAAIVQRILQESANGHGGGIGTWSDKR